MREGCATYASARALRLERFERGLVLRAELAADDGRAAPTLAQQRLADGSANLSDADNDTGEASERRE